MAIVGCGTSFYMAQSFADLRERFGHGETDAFLHQISCPPLLRHSRRADTQRHDNRGASAAGDAAEQGGNAHGRGHRDPDTPVVELADRQVVWTSPMKINCSNTVCHHVPGIVAAWLGEDLTAVIGQGRSALIDPLPPPILESAQFTFLGTGMSIGIANEAALKLREASQSWTESYPAMEFRHGPISVVGRASTIWVFGPPPQGLLEDLEVTGAHVESGGLDPMADLIRAQRLAAALAEARRAQSRRVPAPGTVSQLSEMTSGDLVSGVDVGGTTIKAAVFDLTDSKLPQRAANPQTPRPDAVIETIIHTIREQSRQVPEGRLRAVGLVVPGIVDAQQGIAVYAANIGWQQSPLRQIVAEAVGLPILDHDVRAAGLAELELGAGQGLAGGSLRCIEALESRRP